VAGGDEMGHYLHPAAVVSLVIFGTGHVLTSSNGSLTALLLTALKRFLPVQVREYF